MSSVLGTKRWTHVTPW